MDNPIYDIERENVRAALERGTKEPDEDYDVLPQDPEFQEPQPEDDLVEALGGLQEDDRGLRNQLYFALKDTRGEPGLSIQDVASQVMNAFSREEVASLVRELDKNLSV